MPCPSAVSSFARLWLRPGLHLLPRIALRASHMAGAGLAVVAMGGCGGGGGEPANGDAPVVQDAEDGRATAQAVVTTSSGPAAGYFARGTCTVPDGAHTVTSASTRVIGNGTPASCTSDAVVAAVAAGGVTRFNCGPNPVVITMTKTAKVFNNKPDVVLDGGGKVTLSGGGKLRILYQNTCDANQVYTSTRCDIQDSPRTTLQDITLVDGNSTGQTYGRTDVYGGGAVFVRGGRFKTVRGRYFRNQCEATGPDMGGGALRFFMASPVVPVYIVHSTIGGASGYGNSCSNGGGISGLGSSVSLLNTLMTDNKAIGYGQNPAKAGTPGGGSGGAIYQDGNTMSLQVCGSHLQANTAREGGGAVIYVSNNHTGTLSITNSLFDGNPSGTFESPGLPGMFVIAKDGQPVITNSTLTH